ncbi:hypothetical protein TNCV_309601 [Trichonephila clavipes]|nr:hypothetical protein TNCV_309601 [Trichonephila clavipes]
MIASPPEVDELTDECFVDSETLDLFKWGIFGKHLSVEEMMTRYYGHHYFRQYIKDKPVRIPAHYEQLSEFDRSIGLKEAGWANSRIACHMGRNNAAIRRR